MRASFVMFIDLQEDYHSNYFPKIPHRRYRFQSQCGLIEDTLPLTAMLSRGRR